MEIKIRTVRESDLAFIYATFLRGLYYGNSWYGTINKKDFFDNYPAVLDKIIRKSLINIACLTEDEDVILGYSIAEPGILHWVGVKEAWRMQGIAKKLLADFDIKAVTHTTKAGDAIRKKKNWIYNPFLI